MINASEARDLATEAWTKNAEENDGVVKDVIEDIGKIVKDVASEGGKSVQLPLADQWAFPCTELLRDELLTLLEALGYHVELKLVNATRESEEGTVENFVQPQLTISWDTLS